MTIFPATIELNLNNALKKFQLNFKVCPNPDCECNGVNMVLYDENKEIHLLLDFATESYRENNYPEEETKILIEFINFLKSEHNDSLNLKFFKDNYEFVKERVRNKRDALNSFEPGVFMFYRDFLWYENDIEINIDETNYLVLDSYCVSLNCHCTEVALTFFKSTPELDYEKPDFSFVFNYVNGSYREQEGINNDKIKDIIPIIPKHFNIPVRHAKLKKESGKDIKRKIKERGFVLNLPKKRKLGRNELCHCGSQKKYKKCCLNGDIKKYGYPIKV